MLNLFRENFVIFCGVTRLGKKSSIVGIEKRVINSLINVKNKGDKVFEGVNFFIWVQLPHLISYICSIKTEHDPNFKSYFKFKKKLKSRLKFRSRVLIERT
jgi:hypothetical protein